jgi:methionyl-tRNA formyltransferase
VTRLAFLGTPEVAAVVLRALHGAGHQVALVVTAPDRRRGRGSALVPTAVKQCAAELGLPLSDRIADVLGARIELGVVVAFGSIIRRDVLAEVPMVNLHFSLLPRWRGAAPVERAILAGDERTGVCLMALDEGLDTGPVFARVETQVHAEETAAELRSRLADLGASLLIERLAGGVATLGTAEPQVGGPLYAAKIKRSELQLVWERPAIELGRLVRVGRAWTTFRGKRLIVEGARVVGATPGGDRSAAGLPSGELPTGELPATGTLLGDEVVCGEGRLELLEVRPEGRSAQSFDSWQRGARVAVGERLGG